MTKNVCTRCDGSGWASAARDAGMLDAPIMLQPIGVFQCPNCGGSGKKSNFNEEALKKWWDEQPEAWKDKIAGQFGKNTL